MLVASTAWWDGSPAPSAAPDIPVPAQGPKAAERRVAPRSAQPRPQPAESPIAAAPSSELRPAAELRPAEVIGNIDCNMKVGTGPASGSAVVVVPALEGARFSVLGAGGTLASGSLPFHPHIVELGVQPDGTPVFGLGDLRLNSGVFRERDTAEPVRIWVGERVAYESDKAWDFLVAPDGSSFAVHEPLAGDGSRLVVNNLQTGEERHFDLGTRFTPFNDYEPSAAIRYSLDGSEIIFYSSQTDASGLGTYWFYPTGEGRVRRIEVEGGRGAVLASSSEGYLADQPPDLGEEERDSVWRVTKRRFDAGEGSAGEAWSRTLDLRIFDGDMFASDDGRWLALQAWDFHVLDTDTGNVVFRYPMVASAREHVARLGSVVGEGASASDLGRLSGILFKGGNMLFLREFGQRDCSTPPGEQYDERRYRTCLRALRKSGAYRAVYDVYDMDRISVDATPYHRAEVRMDGNCALADPSLGGLRDRRGRLAYVPARPRLD